MKPNFSKQADKLIDANNDDLQFALNQAYEFGVEQGRQSVLEKWPSKKEVIELSKKICKAEHCQHAFYKGYRAAHERLGVGDK
jgi:hypothetical protein